MELRASFAVAAAKQIQSFALPMCGALVRAFTDKISLFQIDDVEVSTAKNAEVIVIS